MNDVSLLSQLAWIRMLDTQVRLGTGEFPAQMASNAENVSIWWRHCELWQVIYEVSSRTFLGNTDLIEEYSAVYITNH